MRSRVAMLLCVLGLTAQLLASAAGTASAANGELAAGPSGEGGAFQSLRAPVPPFECEAYVAYDLDQKLPGYILPSRPE